MTKILLSIATLFLLAAAGNAQNTFPATGAAGIGTTSPNASSLLEIRSVNKGMLIPRMTQAQRDAIATPATGLLIYQTNNTPSFYWYTGSGWKSLSDAATNLSNLSGTAVNSSLLPGTTGNIDLGSNTKKWRSGYFLGSVRAGSLNIDSGLTVSKGGLSSIINAGKGVYGESTSGSGVYGKSPSATGYGVYGYNKSTGAGVYGYSSSGQGVAGFSNTNYGVYGFGSGTGSTGVHGEGEAYGVYGSSGQIGVYGNGNAYGIFGSSSGNGTGVAGSGFAGVYGNGSSYGIYGNSVNGTGVYGYSNSSNGVYGQGTTGVYGNGYNYGMYAISSNGTGVYGLGQTGISGYGSGGVGIGIYGSGVTGVAGYGNTNNGGIGVYGGGSGPVGVYGTGYQNGIYGTTPNGGSAAVAGYAPMGGDGVDGYSAYGIGVDGYSGTYNGGRFVSGDNIGISATALNGTSYAAEFSGKVYMSEQFIISDKNLKKNIQDFTSAISIINKLKPKYYEFDDDNKYTFLHPPKGKHYGLLAQDLEQVLPNLVNESWHRDEHLILQDANSTVYEKSLRDTARAKQQTKLKSVTTDSVKVKAVNYIELIPIMIKGMQEQQAQIQSLSAKNEDLQNQIEELKTLISKNNNSKIISFTTSSAGYLKQNIPNPTGNSTIIGYYVPANTGKAQIRITDEKGSTLKVYTVTSSEVQLSIQSGELPAGIYNYSLYVNGKMIDTKQMEIMK